MLRWQDQEESARERQEAARLQDHRTTLLAESIALATRLDCSKIIMFGVVRSACLSRVQARVYGT